MNRCTRCWGRVAVLVLVVIVLAGCGTVRTSSPAVGDGSEMQTLGASYVDAGKATATAAAGATLEAVAATVQREAVLAGTPTAAAQSTSEHLAFIGTATVQQITLEAMQRDTAATSTAQAADAASTAVALAAMNADATREAAREITRLERENATEWTNVVTGTLQPFIGLAVVVAVLVLAILALYRVIQAGTFRAHLVKVDERGNAPVMVFEKTPETMSIYDSDREARYTRAVAGTLTPQQQRGTVAAGNEDAPYTLQPPPPAELPDNVSLRALLNGDRPRLNHLALGITVRDGQLTPVFEDLSRLVHVAVGGSSGFGKSNFLRSYAFQIAMSPERPELVICDIEAVTFGLFETCGRLRYPITSEPDEIAAVFGDLNDELSRRRELYTRYPGVDSLTAYNALALDEEPLQPIVVICDEVTALLKNADVGKALETLALRGRKFGLWLTLAAQNWKASNIDTTVRDQLASRFQLAAMDASQSRVLVGTSDAADLETVGRAHAYLPGRGRVVLQTPHVTRRELLTAFTNGHGGGPLHPLPATDEDEATQRIRALHRDGESDTAIAREVFGYANSRTIQRVRDVLQTNDDNDGTLKMGLS